MLGSGWWTWLWRLRCRGGPSFLALPVVLLAVRCPLCWVTVRGQLFLLQKLVHRGLNLRTDCREMPGRSVTVASVISLLLQLECGFGLPWP